MGNIGQEHPGELRINLRLQKPDQVALGKLISHCWPQAKSRARAIRTAIEGYPVAMDALADARNRIESLERLLRRLAAADQAIEAAQGERRTVLRDLAEALGENEQASSSTRSTPMASSEGRRP